MNITGYVALIADAFQFLIGTLKTVEHLVKYLETLLFQFLIGTLKTETPL